MRYRCRRSWLRRSRKYKKPASRCNRDSLCRKYIWNNCCMKRSRRYRILTTRRSRDWFCIRCIGRMNCKSCIRKCMILKKPYIRDEPYRNCNFRHKRSRRVRFRRCSLNCYIEIPFYNCRHCIFRHRNRRKALGCPNNWKKCTDNWPDSSKTSDKSNLMSDE